MSKEADPEEIESKVEAYFRGIHQEFQERWEIWPLRIDNPGPSEVIIGLLRRQVTLVFHLGQYPGTWTPEFAPIILRCMVEIYIWMAWILKDPADRAKNLLRTD